MPSALRRPPARELVFGGCMWAVALGCLAAAIAYASRLPL